MTMAAFPAQIAGPAIIVRGGYTWYSEGDINIEASQEEWEPTTSRFGGIGLRIKGFPIIKISFTPDGQVTTARFSAAYPYTAASVGKSIFGAADVPLVLNSLTEGKTYTFLRTGPSGCPGLYLGVDKTAFTGSMQFTAICGSGLDPTAVGSYMAIATVAYPGDAGFDETKIITPGFTAAYGAVTGIESVAGFKFECPIKTQTIAVNRFGIVDEYLTSVGPAKCVFAPAGMAAADFITLANLDSTGISIPGTSGSATDLVVTGGNLAVTMAKCNCMASKMAFGTSKERFGELTFDGRTVFTAGVPAKLLGIVVS